MHNAGLFELNAVVAVASRRSFRAAAQELGMSPSGLSHAIAVLEARIGVRLFNRTTRSVALSEAGEQFLTRVRPALHEIAQAMEEVNTFRDTPKGLLRINTSEGAALQIFEPLILPFLAGFPEMRVDLVTDGRPVDIVAEGFDAGIRLAESVPQDMIAIPCGPPQRFAVVGSPDYFAARSFPASPADLGAHRCIRSRLPSGAPLRWEFEKNGEEIVIDPEGPLTLDSPNLRMTAALRGLGLSYVVEPVISGDLAAGRLVRVLEDWTPHFPGLCLYYSGRRHVPAGLRAFIGIIRERMKNISR